MQASIQAHGHDMTKFSSGNFAPVPKILPGGEGKGGKEVAVLNPGSCWWCRTALHSVVLLTLSRYLPDTVLPFLQRICASPEANWRQQHNLNLKSKSKREVQIVSEWHYLDVLEFKNALYMIQGINYAPVSIKFKVRSEIQSQTLLIQGDILLPSNWYRDIKEGKSQN